MPYPEYEADVIRTLSLQFNLQDTPGGPHPTSGQLRHVLLRAVDLGDEVDALKRSIFYGSVYPDEAARRVAEPVTLQIQPGDDTPGRPSVDMLHSAMGIFTEAAELLAAICASAYAGTEFDHVNAVEELGDLEWYMAVLRSRLGVSQESVQRRNIAKLKARYPERFASEHALNRDLTRERNALDE